MLFLADLVSTEEIGRFRNFDRSSITTAASAQRQGQKSGMLRQGYKDLVIVHDSPVKRSRVRRVMAEI
jgi:hypothetical protein